MRNKWRKLTAYYFKFWIRFTCRHNKGKNMIHALQYESCIYWRTFKICLENKYHHIQSKPLETKHDKWNDGRPCSSPRIQCLKSLYLCRFTSGSVKIFGTVWPSDDEKWRMMMWKNDTLQKWYSSFNVNLIIPACNLLLLFKKVAEGGYSCENLLLCFWMFLCEWYNESVRIDYSRYMVAVGPFITIGPLFS